MGWYPSRSHYFASVTVADEIEQGDVFWGVPIVRAAHPAVANQFLPLGHIPDGDDLDAPTRDQVTHGIEVSADAVMILPHTCDFYGPEKGQTHRDRLVARIQPVRGGSILDAPLLLSGEGYRHTFFLPFWDQPDNGGSDLFMNFRYMTTVDASYLSRHRRLARLSRAAIICLRRRLSQFFTDYAPMPSELVQAEERGGIVRENRDLVSTSELRTALGRDAYGQMMRTLYDPRQRTVTFEDAKAENEDQKP